MERDHLVRFRYAFAEWHWSHWQWMLWGHPLFEGKYGVSVTLGPVTVHLESVSLT